MNNMSVEKIISYLDNYIDIINSFFYLKEPKDRPITYEEVFSMTNDMNTMINALCKKDYEKAGIFCIKKFIPLLQLLLKIARAKEKLIMIESILYNAYRISARISLEHYFIFREWYDDDKFFAPRYEILSGYIHYLQELVTNPNFHLIIFNAPSGYGKLISNDTKVLTKNGWKKHGDLVVGDYVISPNGNYVKVTEIHPKRFANVKVIFEDGEEIICHSQHEWLVYDRLARKEKIVETQYLMDNLKTKDGRNRFLIPLKEVIKGEQKDLPIDPYTFGVWLGDGSTYKSCITENINDFEIFNHIPYKITSINNGTSENVKCCITAGLLNDLHKLNLGYKDTEKDIPDIYLIASKNQRLELLAGIIDTDGYLDSVKQRYIVTTTSKKIRDGVITLINSFGWRSSVTTVNPIISSSGIKGKKDVFYISFSPTFEVPCKLERKKIKRFHKQRRIGINEIKFITPVEGNCITVDGGLYLVGKTLKITHNSFPEKISEAWAFGLDPTGTVLSLCSNEDVVLGGSRTVIDEIKSEAFGEVFPDLKYSKDDKDFFLKETAQNWKLRKCKLPSSYIARTVQSNVVGTRASQRIHIDDLYADYLEAMNKNLNDYYYNKYLTVWQKRFVQNKLPKIVVTGTLWATGDFIDLLIHYQKKLHKFHLSKEYKYTLVSEDESVVIIQVPALDYFTQESTCPELRSTIDILKEKDAMDEYLFMTNFQQIPTDPEALSFSYAKLRTYEACPKNDDTINAYSVIDATRKSGKDNFAMPILVKTYTDTDLDYYLKDCIFTKMATKDLYDAIVDKIIEHHIVLLVIESNVTTELANALKERLKARGSSFCEFVEKYNTVPKATRIEAEKGVVLKRIIFPKKGAFGRNTDMGRFMDNLTSYNANGHNDFDDGADSMAMFGSEIIEEGSKPAKVKAVFRPF